MNRKIDLPMFTKDDVDLASHPLAKLIRSILAEKGITEDEFDSRCLRSLQLDYPGHPKKNMDQKIAADKEALYNPRVLTFNMLRNILKMLGYEVKNVSLDVYDAKTHTQQVFSSGPVDAMSEVIANALADTN